MTDPRVIAVVTGTRAEFGLLRPVMRAIATHSGLTLRVIACGSHLLPPARTIDEVAAEFPIAATIEMQRAGACGRSADAAALGRGIVGLADHFAQHPLGVVLVLGDRIEAFAAATAAAVGGIRVAHIHGGDRAEGIADESLRHAITKLAHIHLPATEQSAHRIIAMGEDPQRVHVVGSPAIDGLEQMPALDDSAFQSLGSPTIVFLLHPAGGTDEQERELAASLIEACMRRGRVLALHPNHDPGRAGIVDAIRQSGVAHRPHLPRPQFVGLLKRAPLLVSNSSAGLIECVALGVRVINVGPRQAGRERAANVIDLPNWREANLDSALARPWPTGPIDHPFGDGRAGPRTADLLADLNLDAHPVRKRNTY